MPKNRGRSNEAQKAQSLQALQVALQLAEAKIVQVQSDADQKQKILLREHVNLTQVIREHLDRIQVLESTLKAHGIKVPDTHTISGSSTKSMHGQLRNTDECKEASGASLPPDNPLAWAEEGLRPSTPTEPASTSKRTLPFQVCVLNDNGTYETIAPPAGSGNHDTHSLAATMGRAATVIAERETQTPALAEKPRSLAGMKATIDQVKDISELRRVTTDFTEELHGQLQVTLTDTRRQAELLVTKQSEITRLNKNRAELNTQLAIAEGRIQLLESKLQEAHQQAIDKEKALAELLKPQKQKKANSESKPLTMTTATSELEQTISALRAEIESKDLKISALAQALESASAKTPPQTLATPCLESFWKEQLTQKEAVIHRLNSEIEELNTRLTAGLFSSMNWRQITGMDATYP